MSGPLLFDLLNKSLTHFQTGSSQKARGKGEDQQQACPQERNGQVAVTTVASAKSERGLKTPQRMAHLLKTDFFFCFLDIGSIFIFFLLQSARSYLANDVGTFLCFCGTEESNPEPCDCRQVLYSTAQSHLYIGLELCREANFVAYSSCD